MDKLCLVTGSNGMNLLASGYIGRIGAQRFLCLGNKAQVGVLSK